MVHCHEDLLETGGYWGTLGETGNGSIWTGKVG